MMADDMERRRSPRAKLRGRAEIEHREVGAAQAHVLDVGVGGMALLTSGGAPPGYLRIRFKLGPQSGDFDVGGTVVSQRRADDQTVWGVKFHGIDLGTRVRLRDYVARQRRRESSV